MEKPLLEMKRFGRKIHLIVEKLAKEHGIESMAGPQGQVLHIVACRTEEGKDTLNKRAKYIRLTPQSQERMKKIRDFFDEMDRSILNGVSERELLIFSQVMTKFYQNIESLENGGKDV